ncbi:MAG: PEP/pyruvate-binding domain-containing protein [Syntrophobacteraceae bacterium]
MQVYVAWLDDPETTEPVRFGRKAANLGKLVHGGFVVPPGFVVGAAAYSKHISTQLKSHIADVLCKIDFEDPIQLEACVSEIRSRIMGAGMPRSVQSEIEQAYKKLGADTYVAVRSSYSAENLGSASFAGLYDTYLNILGTESVLDAVKCCWASMWTARAVSYRETQGFDHFKMSLAVVVQTMVEAEVAGVMFTGNPANTATDEILINASWGLGEAVVSGKVTPDEYIVKNPANAYNAYSNYDRSGYADFQPTQITTDTKYVYTYNPTGLLSPDEPRPSLRTYSLRELSRTVGNKDIKIVRDPVAGIGTIDVPVAEGERAKFTLSEEQVKELADIGRRIQAAYDGFPQDIEFALKDGRFYILQTRPITGTDFSWDAEVTASIQGNDDETDDDQIWSLNFPEEMWTGAITPLMFSWRGWGLCACHSIGVQLDGYPELDYDRKRLWIYYKGLSYYNCSTDRDMIKLAIPPHFREAYLDKLPPPWHEDTLKEPFDWSRYINMFLQVETKAPHMGWNWWRSMRADYILNKKRNHEHTRISPEQLKLLSNDELKLRIWQLIVDEVASYDPPWHGLLWYMREAVNWMGWMISKWYDGERPGVMMDLMTGTLEPTVTLEDNFAIGELSKYIHKSKALSALFEKYPDARFLAECENSEEGREFLSMYAKVLKERAHRGHADTDMYFPRRGEDPMVDIRLFKALKGTEDPRVQERKARAKLEETIEHVIENIGRKPFGAVKAEAFRALIDFIHHSIDYRDNIRDFMDRSTFAIKLAFKEVNRRIMERGLFDSDRDFYFLTMHELYDVLDGKGSLDLAKAKIAARMRNFENVCQKTITPPYYLQRGSAIDPDTAAMPGDGVCFGKSNNPGKTTGVAMPGDGVYFGKSTSRGKVTGVARVVCEIGEIDRLARGEILVVNSTDPGWTPVFMYISGIVLETGGLISHSALLAREYGLPSVQIPGILNLIPDGATITVDGDAGMVIVHQDPQNQTSH